MDEQLSRRRFLALASGAVGLAALGCPAADPVDDSRPASPVRLRSRLRAPTDSSAAGLHPLRLAAGRDGLLYVPRSRAPDRAAPLLLLLHGAGGNAAQWFGPWIEHAEDARMVVVAPDSRATTWQMGQRSSGRDAGFIDRLLAHVSDRVSIDPERVAVGGFSDGASYALELGLANGDLFHRVIAFSPGILAAAPPHGRPRVFVSHGTADTILPIDRCSRVFVPMLRRVGYDVEYVEFDGGHQVPAAIRARALAWLGWAPPPAPPSVPQRPDIGIATSLIR